jgi:hypothetical protein
MPAFETLISAFYINRSYSWHGNVQRLRGHFGKYDGLLEQLKKKYEQAVKAKALIALERDKLRTMVDLAFSTSNLEIFAHMISNHEEFFSFRWRRQSYSQMIILFHLPSKAPSTARAL